MRMVGLEEIGAALPELAQGEGLVLVAGGRPVARLVPLGAARAGRLPGWDGYSLRGALAALEDGRGPD